MALFGIAEAVVGVVDNVLDKFVEDKDLRAKLDHELKTQVQHANLAQISVNQEQARICIPTSMFMGYGYMES